MTDLLRRIQAVDGDGEFVVDARVLADDATALYEYLNNTLDADVYLDDLPGPAAPPRPVVIIDMTGGVRQGEITLAGVGAPDVWSFDFDKERGEGDCQHYIEQLEELIPLVGDRRDESSSFDGPAREELQDWLNGERAMLEHLVAEREANDAEYERSTRRQRAAALLTDADISGILDAHEQAGGPA